MLKILLVISFFSFTLFANETIEEQLGKCEDSYVVCSAKCEESDSSDPEKCTSICEKLYYDCETKVTESFEEKQ